MKNLITLFAILITGFASAQNFIFYCGIDNWNGRVQWEILQGSGIFRVYNDENFAVRIDITNESITSKADNVTNLLRSAVGESTSSWGVRSPQWSRNHTYLVRVRRDDNGTTIYDQKHTF